MDHIRLFAALKVSNQLMQQIASLPRKGLDSPRWSHSEDLHITLRFVGDVAEEQLPAILETLEGVRVKIFKIVVRGLDIFEKKHQRILYAPVESARMVTHLSAEITERLQKAGLVFTEQHYTPHVTIARLKSRSGLLDYVMHHKKKIYAEWETGSFTLFRSAEPNETGKRYTALKEYKLTDY